MSKKRRKNDPVQDVEIGAILAAVGITAYLGYQLIKGIGSSIPNLNNISSGIQNDFENFVKGITSGFPKLPSLPNFTLPPAGSPQSTKQSSPTEQTANQAFQTEVAPYLASTQGQATALQNLQFYAGRMFRGSTLGEQTPEQFQAQENLVAKTALPQFFQPSAGLVFSGETSGYGQVLSGQRYLEFNKSEEG